MGTSSVVPCARCSRCGPRLDGVRCPGDGRGLNATLTDVGAERLRDATPAHLAGVRHRFLDRLDPEDLTRLADIWRRLGGD